MPQEQTKVIRIAGQEVTVPSNWTQAHVEIYIKSGRFQKDHPEQFSAAVEENKRTTSEFPETAGGIIGGGVGSMVGGPATGMLARAGGAALGGAIGRGAGQIIEGIFGSPAAPKSPMEAVEKIGTEAAVQGGGQLVFGGLGKLGTMAFNKIFTKLESGQAARLIANEISKQDMSPAEVGQYFRKVFEVQKKNAGVALGASKDVIKEGLAKTKGFQVNPRRTLSTIDEEIATIDRKIGQGEASRAETNNLSKVRESLQLLKARLTEQLTPPTQFRKGGVGEPLTVAVRPIPARPEEITQTLFDARTDFFDQAREFDPMQAKRIAGRLAKATHGDIVANASAAGLRPQVADFLSKSSRYRELVEIPDRLTGAVETGEGQVMAKIIGDRRVTNDKVVGLLADNPETAVDAIRIIKRGQKSSIDRVKRAIFENMMAKGKLSVPNDVANEALVRETFGADATKVSEFRKLFNEAEVRKGKVLSSLVDFVSARVGPMRVAVSDLKGNVVLIDPKKMSKILADPSALDKLVKLAQQPVNERGQAVSKHAANLLRSLWLTIESVGEVESWEKPEPSKRQEGSGIATLEEIARAKGIEIRRK